MYQPINRLIETLLNIANLADEKQETPFDSELGLGYRAFSLHMRDGAREIIKLQDEYQSAKERANYLSEQLKEWESFSKNMFGRIDAVEVFTEEEKVELREKVNEILSKYAL